MKRVIGVAGDTITCCDDQGRILVNGVPLDEGDYIAPRRANIACNGPMISTCEWTAGPVPDGSVFVMGDNRANSADSTVHLCLEGETDCTDDPFVDVDLVVGKVVRRSCGRPRTSTSSAPPTRSPTSPTRTDPDDLVSDAAARLDRTPRRRALRLRARPAPPRHRG